MSRKLELAVVKRLLPKQHASLLTQDFLDRVEAAISDSSIAEQFKENFISYTSVLRTGKYSLEEYVNAVKYISFKMLGYSNRDAYAATFPDRYKRLVDNGQCVDAFTSAYNKGKLVNQIFEQTLVPTYILNAPLHQEALNELAKMIKNPDIRGMTKVKACEAILAYTKPPEVSKAELKIDMGQQETIAELREVTEELAAVLQDSLTKGHKSLKDITDRKIIDVTPKMEAING